PTPANRTTPGPGDVSIHAVDPVSIDPSPPLRWPGPAAPVSEDNLRPSAPANGCGMVANRAKLGVHDNPDATPSIPMVQGDANLCMMTNLKSPRASGDREARATTRLGASPPQAGRSTWPSREGGP